MIIMEGDAQPVALLLHAIISKNESSISGDEGDCKFCGEDPWVF